MSHPINTERKILCSVWVIWNHYLQLWWVYVDDDLTWRVIGRWPKVLIKMTCINIRIHVIYHRWIQVWSLGRRSGSLTWGIFDTKQRIHFFLFLINVIISEMLVAVVDFKMRVLRRPHLDMLQNRRVWEHGNTQGALAMSFVLSWVIKLTSLSKSRRHLSQFIMANSAIRIR